MTELYRPLSPMEYGLWFMDLAARSNFMFAAELDGRISVSALTAAAAAVAVRHPLLNTAIRVKRNKQAWFVPAEKDPLVTVDSGSPEPDLSAVLAEENHRRIDTENGPLFRVRLLDRGDRRILLVVFHHSVADGVCGSHILQDLLLAADEIESGRKPNPAVIPPPGPMEDRLDKSHKDSRALVAALTKLLVQGVSKNLLRRYAFPPLDMPVPVDQRQQRFVLKELDAPTTALLIDRARQNRAGVHAALCAAQLLAMAAEMPEKVDPLIPQLSLVNMRSRLEPPVDPRAAGVYISSVESAHRVNPNRGLWDLAREIRTAVMAGMKKGEPFTYWPSLMRLMYLGRRTRSVDARGAAAALRQGEIARPAAAITSNLGRIKGETAYRNFAVERLYFLMAISGSGYFSCSTNSFNGRLHLNFTYAHPDISDQRAAAMAEKTCQLLRSI